MQGQNGGEGRNVTNDTQIFRMSDLVPDWSKRRTQIRACIKTDASDTP